VNIVDLEEYKEWLRENANKEEEGALNVVEKILKHHETGRTKFVQLFPHFRYKGIEFDLLILLSNKKMDINKLDETLGFHRLIAVEFKETDIRKVVGQAIVRKEFVDYIYVATKYSAYDYVDIFLMALFGIGWILFDKNFAKIVLPAKFYDTQKYKIKELVDVLLSQKFKEVVEEVFKERFNEKWKEWVKNGKNKK